MELTRLHMRTVAQARTLMEQIGCHATGVERMAPKATLLLFELCGLLPQAANILKQEMLAKGGEVAVPEGALRMDVRQVDCLISGTVAQYRRLLETLPAQPFGLAALASQLNAAVELGSSQPAVTWFGSRHAGVVVGGIVDCDTCTSGVTDAARNTVSCAWHLLEEGADFLVVKGRGSSVVRSAIDQISPAGACPVATWVLDQTFETRAAEASVVVERTRATPRVPVSGPVFALPSSHDPVPFLASLLEAQAGPERLFVTLPDALEVPAMMKPSGYRNVASGVPRLDAVIALKQDLTPHAPMEQAAWMARLVMGGVLVILTDTPRSIRRLSEAAQNV
jgi:hypothetical protein